MRLSTVAIVIVVSFVVITTAVATARMYTYDPSAISLDQRMQQEMSQIVSLQQRYQSGQITQEGYQQSLQNHMKELQELRDSRHMSHPMIRD